MMTHRRHCTIWAENERDIDAEALAGMVLLQILADKPTFDRQKGLAFIDGAERSRPTPFDVGLLTLNCNALTPAA